MRLPWLTKVRRGALSRFEGLVGRLGPWQDTVAAMTRRPFELHIELTNLCNADCIFCPYQFQQRPKQFMSDEVFTKTVDDFVAVKGGSVALTPIVGDALIDPQFLERVRYLRRLPEIDRIYLTTNAILLDRFGIDDVLTSGINSMVISTSGFDRDSYLRIYRNRSYERMRRNVQALVERNAALGNPVNICIGLRTDRRLSEVMRDPDFQPILAHQPEIDFTWSFTSAGGRITRAALPAGMQLRHAPPKTEPCASLMHGPIVLPDGDVLGCSCVAAMDARPDLLIGNVLEASLQEIWTGPRMMALRAQFEPGGTLNPTCAGCEMYRDLRLYRTREGRTRAEINNLRAAGTLVKRTDRPQGPFAGG
jgi:radical SAM protein with 4Fe4S-binding SPASM domain